MGEDAIYQLSRQAMEITLMLCAVTLLPALVVGLLVSVFQAATQINEMTLSFVPKLVAVLVSFMVAGPWMIERLRTYTESLFANLPWLIH